MSEFSITLNNIDEAHRHNVEKKKLDTKILVYDLIFIEFKKGKSNLWG